MLIGKLVAALAAATVAAAEGWAATGVNLKQLSEENFKASIATGLWLVEHFSPRCHHCRAFAPTWEELVKKKASIERLTGFHMGQINCLAQGDLCNDNGVKGYPTINLYADGKFVAEYEKERAFPFLSEWIDEKALAYARGEPLLDETPEDYVAPERYSPVNAKGEVVEVDKVGLDKFKAEGPVLVDFFAPWCSHCKRLRPTYDKLAALMRGSFNIAAVNCDDNGPLCRENGVVGYPTILLIDGEKVTPYLGARSLGKMQQFLEKESKGLSFKMPKIMVEDFENIVAQDDPFFLHLQNFDTSAEEIEQVEKVLRESEHRVAAYTSSDPLLYSNLSIARPPPTSMLISFSAHVKSFDSSISLPVSDEDLARWVRRQQVPTLQELTTDNYFDIMKNDQRALVVVGAVRTGDAGLPDRAELLKTARAWKRGGRAFDQPVWFVAADFTEWGKWLERTVDIPASMGPAFAVVDTATLEYYDMTLEGKRARMSGTDAFSVLEGVFQHFLKPKTIDNGLDWTGHSTISFVRITRWSAHHPFPATMITLSCILLLVYLLSKCVSRDRRQPGGYLNEKAAQRLD